jgi:hypothetical protein
MIHSIRFHADRLSGGRIGYLDALVILLNFEAINRMYKVRASRLIQSLRISILLLLLNKLIGQKIDYLCAMRAKSI